MPLALAALQIGQGGMNYGMARQQYKHDKRLYAKNMELIQQGTRDSYGDLMLAALQEMTAIRESLLEGQLNKLQAQGRAATAAGEAGVSGASVDALMRDLSVQQSRVDERSRLNYAHTLTGLKRQEQGVYNSALSQAYSLPMPQRPNVFAHLLGTAANATTSYYAAKSR